MDIGYPTRKRKATVACKRPSLPGGGEVEGDVAGNKKKQNDCSECVHAGHGHGITEDIEKGVGGGIAQCVVDGRDAEYVGYEEDQAHEAIEHVAPHKGRGTMSPASLISSDMWAAPSEPNIVISVGWVE